MGIGKKITKGIIGSGVNLSHKSKMSGEAGRLVTDMPLLKNNSGPGNYGGLQVEKSGIVSKGFMKAKQSYGTKKMGQYGPEKALIGKQKNLPEFLKKEIEAVPEKSAKKKKGMKQMGEMEEAPMSTGMAMSGKPKPKPKPKKEKNNFTPKLPHSEFLKKRKADKENKKEVTPEEIKRKKVTTASVIKNKPIKVQPVEKITGVKPVSGETTIKASTLKTKIKKETDVEKAKRLTVESGKKSGLSEKTKSLSKKAKRLERKSKRKAGRAERKEIKKDAKDGKISRMKKRADIKASRKKQKK